MIEHRFGSRFSTLNAALAASVMTVLNRLTRR